MKKNRLKKLLIIFAFFIILFLLGEKIPQLNKKDNRAYPQLKAENIKRLEIIDNKSKTDIYKKGKSWYTKGAIHTEFPADLGRIDEMIKIITALKKDEVISENKSKYSEFEVEGKRKINIYSNSSTPGVIYIGKQHLVDANYFRTGNDPAVYIASIDLGSLLEQNDYRDLGPHLLEEENNVSLIDISWEKNKLDLTKMKGNWLMKDGKKAKLDRVDYLINDIKNLKGNNMFYKNKIDISQYQIELAINIVENGRKKAGIFYKKDDESSFFIMMGSKYVFEIPSVYVASIKKTQADMTD